MASLKKHSSGKLTLSPKKALPPLARRQAKVDWTDIMQRRQVSVAASDITFYHEKAFDSPHQASNRRFYSRLVAEEIVVPYRKHKSLERVSQSFEDQTRSRLAFGASLISRIDDEERKSMVGQSENIELIKSAQQVWTSLLTELDNFPQERTAAARRLALNSQKLVSRAVSLHEQHLSSCSKFIEALKASNEMLKEKADVELKLKEALVVKALDQERLRKEIDHLFENSEDFNYEDFTSSARKLLDRRESQLTHFLIEAYKELTKDRQMPSVVNSDIKLGSLPRWEEEMRRKFV
jgi:hypothetical protein